MVVANIWLVAQCPGSPCLEDEAEVHIDEGALPEVPTLECVIDRLAGSTTKPCTLAPTSMEQTL